MATARINGGIITWALKRAGATRESIATKTIPAARIAVWQGGEEFPSEGQAEALAVKLGIPYAMLFMPTVPPDEKPDLPDLRTIDGKPLAHPSMDFLEVLDDAVARQEWYRSEALEASRQPLEFVGKFGLSDAPVKVAEDMCETLALNTSARDKCKDFEEFLRTIVASAERAGILVMRSSVVRHITSRPLNVKEFRGFALVDDLAPVVFINDNDAKAAQVFTLAHELAHIWIGAPGISDRKPNEKDSKNAIELFCDKVAAEVLVPAKEFVGFWSTSRPLDENLRNVSVRFRVSTLVALRRAKDLNQITPTVFFASVTHHYDAYLRREREKKEAQRKKKGGGNF